MFCLIFPWQLHAIRKPRLHPNIHYVELSGPRAYQLIHLSDNSSICMYCTSGEDITCGSRYSPGQVGQSSLTAYRPILTLLDTGQPNQDIHAEYHRDIPGIYARNCTNVSFKLRGGKRPHMLALSSKWYFALRQFSGQDFLFSIIRIKSILWTLPRD